MVSFDELVEELLDDLSEELQEDEEGGSFNDVILEKKIKNVIREIQTIRRYPSSYTDEMIEDDIRSYYGIIRNLSLYDYNQIGMEFEYTHSEKNTSRTFSSRSKLLYGVLPIVRRF